jgi:hypothetical protein
VNAGNLIIPDGYNGDTVELDGFDVLEINGNTVKLHVVGRRHLVRWVCVLDFPEVAGRKTPYGIAQEIHGTSAAGLLQRKPYASFCQGSDDLVRLGLWDEADGNPSRPELLADVLQHLNNLDMIASLA